MKTLKERKAEAMASPRTERHVALPSLAAMLGKNRATLVKWIDDGCPVVHRGGNGDPTIFDLPDVVRWLETRAAGLDQPREHPVLLLMIETARQASSVTAEQNDRTGDVIVRMRGVVRGPIIRVFEESFEIEREKWDAVAPRIAQAFGESLITLLNWERFA